MAVNRYYSSTAGEMALTGSVSSSDTSMTVNTVSGLPVQTPFTLIVDKDTASEEIVTVTAVGGTTLTVTRGADGSSAQSHTAGAKVYHGITARDLREPQEHIAASSAVHGTTGSVVGTSDTQTLTNKTISGSSNTVSNIAQSSVTGLTTSLSGLDTRISANETVVAGLADVATSGDYGDLLNLPSIPTVASDIGAVPTTRTVNSKALSSNITLAASDVGAVPTTRTVNGHALSSDVTVTVGDLSLDNVDNTSDANKPISTATQTALNGKINNSGTGSMYIRWDGSYPVYGGTTPGSEKQLAFLQDVTSKRALTNGDFDTVTIYNATGRDTPVVSSYYAAYFNSDGRLGRTPSALKYKEDVEPAEIDTNAVLALTPVSYHLKADTDHPDSREIGLIAEAVQHIPNLVVYGEDGAPETVAYERVLPVLLLAVVQEQERRIAALEERLNTLEG